MLNKQRDLYSQMRNLVKTPQLFVAIAGTIVLAATVNFYELLCTLGLPLVFTRQLAAYNLSTVILSLYLFLQRGLCYSAYRNCFDFCFYSW